MYFPKPEARPQPECPGTREQVDPSFAFRRDTLLPYPQAAMRREVHGDPVMQKRPFARHLLSAAVQLVILLAEMFSPRARPLGRGLRVFPGITGGPLRPAGPL